jgi:RNA polymerase sporulation-specific sigma factor
MAVEQGAVEAPADEALVRRAREGDQDALLALLGRYRRLLRALARRYFLPWGELEDLLQEAALGFVKAVRDYAPEAGVPFRPFAELCVTRQVITAVKAATRQKHVPLNAAVSLQTPVLADDDAPTLAEVLADRGSPSPAERAEQAAAWAEVVALMEQTLSPFERRVVDAYLSGLSYEEIARALGTREKAVDNALWRVKGKLRRAFGAAGAGARGAARARQAGGEGLPSRVDRPAAPA